MIREIQKLFLGNSPIWYKQTIVAFLIINPIALVLFNSIGMNGNFIVGWMFLLEFIFTLALALKCYPLQPGGLLAIQAIVLGLTTTKGIYYEIEHNLEVILLLIFMVADIYFMKNLMLTIFTKLLLKVKSTNTIGLLSISPILVACDSPSNLLVNFLPSFSHLTVLPDTSILST